MACDKNLLPSLRPSAPSHRAMFAESRNQICVYRRRRLYLWSTSIDQFLDRFSFLHVPASSYFFFFSFIYTANVISENRSFLRDKSTNFAGKTLKKFFLNRRTGRRASVSIRDNAPRYLQPDQHGRWTWLLYLVANPLSDPYQWRNFCTRGAERPTSGSCRNSSKRPCNFSPPARSRNSLFRSKNSE